MIIGYARVSTSQQDMALQLDALKAIPCDRIFTDTISGTKEDRPGLTKCLNFLKKGDTLVCWKLDRVGRSLRHLVNLVHQLDGKGVGFRVLTGHGAQIDTTTAAGKLVFGIFASLAEFERALIVERVNAGIKAAKERGVTFGAPKKITPEILAQAQAKRGTATVRQIAASLGVSKSTLYDALRAATDRSA